MIYHTEDYNKEKQLVANRIAKNVLSRGYPAQYLQDITPFMEKYYALYDFTPNKDILSLPKVVEAFKLADIAHDGQLRKYVNELYTVHLREVASYVSSLPSHGQDEVIAAILHDVVEKGNVSLQYIKEHFGDKVYEHVYYLTDIATEEDGNREARTLKNWQHFSHGSAQAKNIKAIDILSSARTTMLCDAKYGETYMNVIIELMNPYFQQLDDLDTNVKKTFDNMVNLSIDIIQLQKQHNLSKVEKTYANKLKKLKKLNK